MEDRNGSVRSYLVLLLAVVIPLFALGLSNHGLWTADEPRVAEIGREMALSDNWSVPTLNNRPFLEEPPLYYAAMALTFKAFGVSDKVARIPSALFALGGVLGLFFLGSMLFGPRVGFLSGFILATCGEYFRVAHWAIVDSALACFVGLSLACFMAAYLSSRRSQRILFYGLCYVSCTLAFYTKGFIGVVIPALAILSFLVADRNPREMLRMHLWLGAIVFLVMTLPWFYSLWLHAGTEHLSVFFVHNHLERFAGGSTGHNQPFYYYLTEFPIGFLPWSILLVPVFARSLNRGLGRSFSKGEGGDDRRARERSRKGTVFALCWFIAGFLFLTMASTKRTLYLMPLFAPISLLTGRYIDTALKGGELKGFEKFFEAVFGAIVLIVGLVIVPLYFSANQKFSLGAPLRETLLITVLAGAAIVLAAVAMIWRKQPLRFWTSSGASVFVVLLLGLVAVFPLIDRFKSFVPFCDSVNAQVPTTSPLYAYKPDETLRGAVPFYTGRFLEEKETFQELEKALTGKETAYVVIRDRKGEQERELLSTDKLSVIGRFGMEGRYLVLFRKR